MSGVFADTSFFVALVEKKDELHLRAVELSSRLRSDMVTTSAIILELGARFCPQQSRPMFLRLMELLDDEEVEVVHVDPLLQQRALDMFAARLDKDWSLTDCISFLVMQDRAITHAATGDRHFEQACFIPLLLIDGAAF